MSFPIGRCCLGAECKAPNHQLRKHCPGCNGLIHVMCGRVLFDDEGDFKADATVCPRCDPRSEQRTSNQARAQLHGSDSDEEQSTASKHDIEAAGRSDAFRGPGGIPEDENNENEGDGRKRRTVSSDGNSKKAKSTLPPKPTGRKKEQARVKIAIRKRVKIARSRLYHILATEHQRASIPKDIPNIYCFFGTVVSRSKNKGSWNVKFDVLPVDENVVENIVRTMFFQI